LSRSGGEINKDLLTPKNAINTFTIECTNDICVGDTILLTERIFLKDRKNNDENVVSASVGGKSVNFSKITKANITKQQKQLNTTANTVKSMNMSVTSLNGDGVSITANQGAFVGERTIAAFVSKDNYRTTRSQINQLGITPRDAKKFGKIRHLWLEVVWQRSSNDASKKYEVKVGEVLQREQAHLEQFEVFRCKWKQEEKRKSFYDEWNVLNDCFIDFNS
jgi:hypothetical protein